MCTNQAGITAGHERIKKMKKLYVYILWIISSIVAVGLSRHADMWKWIVAYWIVLSFKNLRDFWSE